MDINWCPICSKRIDFQETNLYCSNECKEKDISSYSSSLSSTPSMKFDFFGFNKNI